MKTGEQIVAADVDKYVDKCDMEVIPGLRRKTAEARASAVLFFVSGNGLILALGDVYRGPSFETPAWRARSG